MNQITKIDESKSIESGIREAIKIDSDQIKQIEVTSDCKFVNIFFRGRNAVCDRFIINTIRNFGFEFSYVEFESKVAVFEAIKRKVVQA